MSEIHIFTFLGISIYRCFFFVLTTLFHITIRYFLLNVICRSRFLLNCVDVKEHFIFIIRFAHSDVLSRAKQSRFIDVSTYIMIHI